MVEEHEIEDIENCLEGETDRGDKRKPSHNVPGINMIAIENNNIGDMDLKDDGYDSIMGGDRPRTPTELAAAK